MEIFREIDALRKHLGDLRKQEKTIAFVPTMGALHGGHKACMDVALQQGDVLVVSIFVNPTQFGPNEDLERYPATYEDDIRCCERWGCHTVFHPRAEEIYPEEQFVWVHVERLSEPMCGKKRPGHFRGVATIVAKLFNVVEPHVAVFGQKDAQQALLIREMARQLDFPVRIVLAPIARAEDGLALSSRNAYLSPDERRRAATIHRSLEFGKELLAQGERDAARIVTMVANRLEESGIEVEYVEVRDANDLSAVQSVPDKMILAVAGMVGSTRLIDNLVLEVRADGIAETTMF